jgi:ribosomal-protein-alanine N-acetyltransferase
MLIYEITIRNGARMENYVFLPISMKEVLLIEKWHYEGYMSYLYMEPYHKNLDLESELKGPGGCDGFAVYLDKDLFGLFEYYHKVDYIEIGLAINPKYINKGYSKSFIDAGILFVKKQYNYQKDFIYLTVEKENTSAYYAYLKSNFTVVSESESEFVMRKKI